MRVTVVGCWGGSPRRGGACSGYLVEEAGDAVLLDCGAGVAGAVQASRALEDIDAVVVSHYHYDHVSDAGALMYARLVHRILGVTARDLMFYAQDLGGDYARLSMEGASRAVPIRDGGHVSIGGLSCSFASTTHPVPCLATRVRGASGATLGYTADAAYSESLAAFMRGVDVLVSECSLYPGVDGSQMGHMSCDDVVRLARLCRPRTLVLSHLPIYGDPHEMLTWVRERAGDACGRVILGCDAVGEPIEVAAGSGAQD